MAVLDMVMILVSIKGKEFLYRCFSIRLARRAVLHGVNYKLLQKLKIFFCIRPTLFDAGHYDMTDNLYFTVIFLEKLI